MTRADFIRGNFDKLNDTQVYALLLLIGDSCANLEEYMPEDGYVTDDNVSDVAAYVALNGIKKALLCSMKQEMDNIVDGAAYGDFASDELYNWLVDDMPTPDE